MTEEEISVHHWERRVLLGMAGALTTVFGIWATVVWNGTQAVVGEVRAMRTEIMSDRIEQEKYRTAMERRLTIVEQRQAYVIEALRDLHNNERVIVP